MTVHSSNLTALEKKNWIFLYAISLSTTPSSIFPTSFPECAIIFLRLIILGGCNCPYSLSLNTPLAIKRLGKGNVILLLLELDFMRLFTTYSRFINYDWKIIINYYIILLIMVEKYIMHAQDWYWYDCLEKFQKFFFSLVIFMKLKDKRKLIFLKWLILDHLMSII